MNFPDQRTIKWTLLECSCNKKYKKNILGLLLYLKGFCLFMDASLSAENAAVHLFVKISHCNLLGNLTDLTICIQPVGNHEQPFFLFNWFVLLFNSLVFRKCSTAAHSSQLYLCTPSDLATVPDLSCLTFLHLPSSPTPFYYYTPYTDFLLPTLFKTMILTYKEKRQTLSPTYFKTLKTPSMLFLETCFTLIKEVFKMQYSSGYPDDGMTDGKK